jgi:hypothetical protein
MNTQIFTDGIRQPEETYILPLGKRRTIAQSIRCSRNPHLAASTSFSRQEILRDKNILIYHFEDESFLSFEVTYTAVEDGGR